MNQTSFTINERLRAYINHECFNPNKLHPAHPYQRPLRKSDLTDIDFSIPVTTHDLMSNKNLLLNKLLLTIYEQDLLFLNEDLSNSEAQKAFKLFYDPHFVAESKALKPDLEKLAFTFLDTEIETLGYWDKDHLVTYLSEIIKQQENQPSELCEFIAHTSNPVLACKMLLIQMAPDFLSEASAMARVLPGAYGQEQSEIMKVFIDEYGYGVYDMKHSSLFERTLDSIGMNRAIHYYYDAYLPTSLMLVNYFHFLCSNKQLWFRYLGALYYTEASIPHFNKQISTLLSKFLPSIDTSYFDEHVHIDQHHRRMVMNKLILTSIDKYGDNVIDEILKGFESFRLLQSLADQDLMEQVRFAEISDTGQSHQFVGEHIIFTEQKNELSLSHIHNESELFTVLEGQLSFHNNGIDVFTLNAGEGVIIPKGRVHGTRVQSPSARYSVAPLLSL
ncbi:MAG: iron-containing redox enzyme family protein [Gammaproteobacteria bacterium]|nr:iron-containing redox enzyme family protein [Gammaproteobacteria bacterium]